MRLLGSNGRPTLYRYLADCENPGLVAPSVQALSADTQPVLRIVSVGEEHLPMIAELAGTIWRACYPGIISQAQIEYMLARMYALDILREEVRSQGIHYDLLMVGSKPAGFASFGPVEETAIPDPLSPSIVGTPRRGVRTAQRAVPTFKLHKLYLLPELHRRGLGSLLLRHVEGELRANGARRVILSVNKHNAQAIAAYRRNGFVIVESVVTDIGGGFVMDDYVMAKELIPDVIQRKDTRTRR